MRAAGPVWAAVGGRRRSPPGGRSGALLCVWLALFALEPAALGTPAVFEVGRFVKSTATGPQRNIPHGLGEVPRAIIFWTAGNASESPAPGARVALGVTDGPGSGRAVSYSAEDAVGVSNTSRRLATKAITVVEWDEALVAEADLLSWDASSFALDWTSNDLTPMIVQFVAIGGGDVRARVVSWQAPAGPGDQPVAVGFQPELIINLHAGADLVNAPPRSQGHAMIGIGVGTRAGEQWAAALMSQDGAILGNGTVSNTARVQVTDSCLLTLDTRQAITARAGCTLTSTGFTARFSVASGNRTQLFTLALGGIRTRAHSFQKPNSGLPARQQVRGMAFQPALVLGSSVMLGTQPTAIPDARWGIGAAVRPSGQVNMGLTDNAGTAVRTTTRSWSRNDKVIVKANNEQGVVTAAAEMTAFLPDGFDLTWTTNDDAELSVAYLALAAQPALPPDAAVPPDAAAPDRAAPDAVADVAVDAGSTPARDAADGPAFLPDAAPDDAPATHSARDINLRVGCGCELGRAGPGPAGPGAPLAVIVALAARHRRRRRR